MTQQIRHKLLIVDADYQRFSMGLTRRAMDKKQLLQIKDKLRTFCETIPKDLTKHETALLLYEVITRCIRYNHDESDTNLRFTYAAAMLTGSAVCMGISELLYILYNACDIESRVVIGCITDSEDYHAWVQLKLPDEHGQLTWYHADPTFDLQENGRNAFHYYLKSDRYMVETDHNWLTERYEACPRNYTLYPKLNPQLVNRVSHEFEKMYSANRKRYIG